MLLGLRIKPGLVAYVTQSLEESKGLLNHFYRSIDTYVAGMRHDELTEATNDRN